MPGQLGTNIITEILPGAVGLTGGSQAITLQSTADGLTAHATGGQGSATPITTKLARFSTVATLHDSSILPAAIAGSSLTVRNDGVAGMDVYPQNNGDIINALAVNTPLTCGAASTTTFRCYTTGKWVSN